MCSVPFFPYDYPTFSQHLLAGLFPKKDAESVRSVSRAWIHLIIRKILAEHPQRDCYISIYVKTRFFFHNQAIKGWIHSYSVLG